MNLLKYAMGLVVAVALTACGGGGGSPGLTSGAKAVATDSIVVAADFIFELDKTTIVNSGGDKAVLTVTAVGSSRNTLAGVPVSVAVDENGILTGSSGAITDDSGRFSGNITIGGDKRNRTINASITVSGITKVASIVVTGSQIAVTSVPATPAPGQLTTLNLSTTDNAGSPIQGVDLVLTGTAGASGKIKTDAAGSNTFTFTAPATAGTYTVVVTGLGVTTTKSIQVVAVGDKGVPVASGSVTASSLSSQPSSIPANAPGSTVNRSKLSAKFLATGNAGIENMRVRFEIIAPKLGSGEAISTENGTVYTDASGTAEAYYISGTRSSPTNGVLVRACYKSTDFTSSTDCLQSVASTLTVAGTPLSVSITDDNKLTKGLGSVAYLKQFLIQVNDSSGVAVKDAVISASVDITHYGKSSKWNQTYRNVAIPSIRYIHDDFDPIPLPMDVDRSLQSSSYVPLGTESIWCINEDWNRNGFLDLGEDKNGDRTIQPRKADIVVSYVSGNKTDVNGQMLVQISYGQSMGGWLAYTLRASTGVAGSEGDASKSYVTDVLKDDVLNGSFLTPPYGFSACNSPN